MTMLVPDRDAVRAARHEASLTATQPVLGRRTARHSRDLLARRAARRAAGRTRLPALDGLRGVAAVVVVVHHVLLVSPALADAHLAPGDVAVGTGTWWLTATPLHLLWAGGEAVAVFFVLSGLVLTLPAVRRGLDLRSFAVSRALRLGPPVWAAVAFAVVLGLLVPPVWAPGTSAWMAAETGPVTLLGVLGDLTLVVAPGATNHVLWSLQWEVVFSALLPLFVVVAVTRRVAWSTKVAVTVVAVAVAALLRSEAGSALALFTLGALLAGGRHHVDYAAAIVEGHRRPGLVWASLAALAALLLSSYWVLHAPGGGPGDPVLVAVTRALQAIGAGLVVVIAWHCPGARRLLEARPVAWLGDRSFSLYLVHLPIVTTAALLLGGAPSPALLALVAGPLVLAATALFHRFVERPCHELARRAGRRGNP